MRTVRSAPGAVWDGFKWVLGKGSDGVGFVWGGIRSGTGFLWDKVTGLSSAAWNVITSFLRERVQEPLDRGLERSIELMQSLNPVGFLQRLLIGFLKVIGIIVLIVLIIFGVFRWGLWMHLARLFWGSAEKGISTIPSPDARRKQQPMAKTIAFKPASTGEQTSPGQDRYRDHERISPAGPSDIAGDTWSRSQIQELRDLVSNQTIIVLFGRASRTDGKPVSDIDLMRATGRSRAQIHADFLSLARLCRIVHPEGGLPVEKVEATAENSIEAYWIPDQYLEWWFEDQG